MRYQYDITLQYTADGHDWVRDMLSPAFRRTGPGACQVVRKTATINRQVQRISNSLQADTSFTMIGIRKIGSCPRSPLTCVPITPLEHNNLHEDHER